MKYWEKLKIKDSSIEIIDGDRSEKYPKRDEFKKEGVLFLNASSISEYGINLDSVNYISQEKFETIKKGRTKYGDLIMTTRGNGVGDIAYFPFKDKEALINAQMLILRCNTAQLYSKFLYYLLSTNRYKEEFINFSSGSAQPQLPISSLREIQICFPPLPTQRRIASILSAYDDLIENNLKRIKLLEEIAQRTYEEWFVKFRVNGEQLPIDEKTGLPVGWTEIQLENLISFQKGKKALDIVTEYKDGYLKLLLLDGIESGKYPFTDPSNQVIADKGDLLMLMDGARSSKVFFADKGVVGSTLSKITIKVENLTSSLLKLFFDANYELMQTNNTGAAIPHANKNFINSMVFPFPTHEGLLKWKFKIEPQFEQIQNFKNQNQKLKESRDILLPKLMNGTINVEKE